MPIRKLILVAACALVIGACASATSVPPASPTSVPATATPSSTPKPTLTPTPAPVSVYADPSLPGDVMKQVTDTIAARPDGFVAATDASSASVKVRYSAPIGLPAIGHRVFALAAAFPTITDTVTLADFEAAWRGAPDHGPLRMTQSTYTALSARLGAAASGAVELIGANQIVDALWQNPAAWGIVPFDELVPRLRALDIDGRSPLRRNLDLNAYPLSVEIVLSGNLEAAAKFQAAFGDPLTNRDESRMTILAMTGVTAMSRDFAAEMDAKGVQYPVELIQDWFTTSDIVHISNEVSFDEDCPKQPTPNRSIFCSNPSYLDLLKESNVKIVELTGNHLNDYGWEPLSYTLSLYDQAGIPYFGGGRTITDGIKAVTLKDHGNTIAFVGCNPVGPPIDWIDGLNDGRPGSVPCASPFQAMQDQIKEAREAGAVVVATLQYYEQPLGDYSYKTAAVQADDFALLADAGASIVSGSQGHSVQGFGLRGDSFIHYGVGNLYFDQMQALNLRQNFIDRYLIYTGRLLSVELLTTIRDEPARLRPMTPAERGELLKTLFELSNWGK